MSEYFATFIPGFKDLVAETIKQDIHNIEIKQLLESSVYFSCDKRLDTLEKKQYFTNVFIVDTFFSIRKDQSIPSIFKGVTKNSHIAHVLRDLADNSSSTSFRFMVQSGSKLTRIPNALRKPFVGKLSKKSQLEYSPLKADLEVWLLIRDEGYAVLGVKVVQIQDSSEKLGKGQLRPHMAHMLNLMSYPSASDVYLDPFAGYGALPLDRARTPFTHIYVSDKNDDLATRLKKKLVDEKVSIHVSDALQLEHIKGTSIDKIVTDPPWGLFTDTDVNYQEFYTDMLIEFERVIRGNGVIVILTAQTTAFVSAVKHVKSLSIEKQYSTLVNGKKASAYKVRVTK